MNKGKSALILGATGLIGSELLEILLASDEYTEVTVLVRKSVNIKHLKLKQQIVSFESLHEYGDFFKVDDVFSCLGTTIKKAKTKENFIRVDHDYTIISAELGSSHGISNFLTVSSIGANSSSRFFYSRVKGVTESDLKKLRLRGLHIFRPSLLLGDRKELRIGEKIGEILGRAFSFLFIYQLKKYKAIEAKTVAEAMYRVALSNQQGIHIYESDEIEKISKN